MKFPPVKLQHYNNNKISKELSKRIYLNNSQGLANWKQLVKSHFDVKVNFYKTAVRPAMLYVIKR